MNYKSCVYVVHVDTTEQKQPASNKAIQESKISLGVWVDLHCFCIRLAGWRFKTMT
jgi:hypothetical protein